VTPVGDLDFTTWSLLFDALWLPDPEKKKEKEINLEKKCDLRRVIGVL